MRASEGFILGAITGAAIVWFWRREIEDYARDKTRGVRTQAAEGLQAVATRLTRTRSLDLLVNDIGRSVGTVRLPDALALEINADGRWTLTAQ